MHFAIVWPKGEMGVADFRFGPDFAIHPVLSGGIPNDLSPNLLRLIGGQYCAER